MPYDMNMINFQVFFLFTFVLLGAFLCFDMENSPLGKVSWRSYSDRITWFVKC